MGFGASISYLIWFTYCCFDDWDYCFGTPRDILNFYYIFYSKLLGVLKNLTAYKFNKIYCISKGLNTVKPIKAYNCMYWATLILHVDTVHAYTVNQTIPMEDKKCYTEFSKMQKKKKK